MTTTSFGHGKAHGKIILLGEHSVVYHEPSIAIPFKAATIEAFVTQNDQPSTHIDCDFYHGLLEDMPELLESLKETIKVCLKQLNQEDQHLKISINSHIPAERGMGSSAAVSVATTRALFDYFHEELTQETLLAIVDIAEHIAHGNPSGLDALMTSSDTPYFYTKGQPLKALSLNLNAVLIVGDTGITGQTKEAVNHIAQQLTSDNTNTIQQHITQLGLLAKDGQHDLENNQPVELGSKMNQVHHHLQALGVSSPELDSLVHAARQKGALGAKLTGGGMGGCMIALASDKNSAHVISKALLDSGAANTWLYEMSET